MEYDPIVLAELMACMMRIESADDGDGLGSNREEMGLGLCVKMWMVGQMRL